MVNQKLYIINLSNFYEIISELKEHIGYEISKFDNKEIFFDKYKKKNISLENSILVVPEKEYDFFVKNWIFQCPEFHLHCLSLIHIS